MEPVSLTELDGVHPVIHWLQTESFYEQNTAKDTQGIIL